MTQTLGKFSKDFKEDLKFTVEQTVDTTFDAKAKAFETSLLEKVQTIVSGGTSRSSGSPKPVVSRGLKRLPYLLDTVDSQKIAWVPVDGGKKVVLSLSSAKYRLAYTSGKPSYEDICYASHLLEVEVKKNSFGTSIEVGSQEEYIELLRPTPFMPYNSFKNNKSNYKVYDAGAWRTRMEEIMTENEAKKIDVEDEMNGVKRFRERAAFEMTQQWSLHSRRVSKIMSQQETSDWNEDCKDAVEEVESVFGGRSAPIEGCKAIGPSWMLSSDERKKCPPAGPPRYNLYEKDSVQPWEGMGVWWKELFQLGTADYFGMGEDVRHVVNGKVVADNPDVPDVVRFDDFVKQVDDVFKNGRVEFKAPKSARKPRPKKRSSSGGGEGGSSSGGGGSGGVGSARKKKSRRSPEGEGEGVGRSDVSMSANGDFDFL